MVISRQFSFKGGNGEGADTTLEKYFYLVVVYFGLLFVSAFVRKRATHFPLVGTFTIFKLK